MSEREDEFTGTDIQPDDADPGAGDQDLDDVEPPDVDDDHVVEDPDSAGGG